MAMIYAQLGIRMHIGPRANVNTYYAHAHIQAHS